MHSLYTHQGLDSFFQLHQAEEEVLFYSMYIPYSPVVELNTALLQTVKLGLL